MHRNLLAPVSGTEFIDYMLDRFILTKVVGICPLGRFFKTRPYMSNFHRKRFLLSYRRLPPHGTGSGGVLLLFSPALNFHLLPILLCLIDYYQTWWTISHYYGNLISWFWLELINCPAHPPGLKNPPFWHILRFWRDFKFDDGLWNFE